MFCCCFLFVEQFVTPVVSEFTGPIFAKLSWLEELWLWRINVKFVLDPSKDIAMITNFCWFYPDN